ncbi:ATP-dependent 6-phosphofructokinase [Spirochaetia bacterium 38H-sp]|uniref:ATP-dependent 6-phosphofructokinase n=1 Tax=Rarispira pelagica TaxID=3141764 RepID=A0ABU9UAB0_9SPIR
MENISFKIDNLGKPSITSPIELSTVIGDSIVNYVPDNEGILYSIDANTDSTSVELNPDTILEKAGPRQKIFFDPKHVHAAIATCGGLCPGLNDVIRSIVRCLWLRYGVRRISGIQYGYRGLLPESSYPIIPLDPDVVDDIHKIGGTMLGSSRGGGERTEELVDALERLNINILFTIGGDGTQKGSLKIANEIEKRGLKIAVVGIPKTIDNDLSFIEKSFGFETAVSLAAQAVSAAHTEAHSAINGVGLVKVMGRESGFIAAHTALAVHEANFVLIPEVPFELEGDNGLLAHLERRLARRNHAVIIVAEGAAEELMHGEAHTDESGNKILPDVGIFLKDKIKAYFKEKNIPVNLKYIDPSYMIRSAPACASDSVYCSRLGTNAVHAAMAGKTKVLIGLVHNTFVHLPIEAVVSRRKKVDTEGSLWRDVLEATQQPISMTNK